MNNTITDFNLRKYFKEKYDINLQLKNKHILNINYIL